MDIDIDIDMDIDIRLVTKRVEGEMECFTNSLI